MARAEAMIEASQGNGVVSVKLFDGRELEVDFKRTGWALKIDEELVDFLSELLSRACWDNLLLANLTVRPITAKTEGKPPVT
jgi:hypothetical protein